MKETRCISFQLWRLGRHFFITTTCRLVLFGELINVDSDNYMKHVTLWTNCRVFNVKSGGKYSNQCALMG